MKPVLLACGIAVVMGVALLVAPSEYSVEGNKHSTSTVEKIIEVDHLEEKIKEAQEASRVEIETSAQTAYNAVYEEKMKEVADSVKAERIAEIEATISTESY